MIIAALSAAVERGLPLVRPLTPKDRPPTGCRDRPSGLEQALRDDVEAFKMPVVPLKTHKDALLRRYGYGKANLEASLNSTLRQPHSCCNERSSRASGATEAPSSIN